VRTYSWPPTGGSRRSTSEARARRTYAHVRSGGDLARGALVRRTRLRAEDAGLCRRCRSPTRRSVRHGTTPTLARCAPEGHQRVHVPSRTRSAHRARPAVGTRPGLAVGGEGGLRRPAVAAELSCSGGQTASLSTRLCGGAPSHGCGGPMARGSSQTVLDLCPASHSRIARAPPAAALIAGHAWRWPASAWPQPQGARARPRERPGPGTLRVRRWMQMAPV